MKLSSPTQFISLIFSAARRVVLNLIVTSVEMNYAVETKVAPVSASLSN